VAPSLTTPQLVLRGWQGDDAADAVGIYGRSEVAGWLSLVMDRVPDVAGMRLLLQQWIAEDARSVPPAGRWALQVCRLRPADLDRSVKQNQLPGAPDAGTGLSPGLPPAPGTPPRGVCGEHGGDPNPSISSAPSGLTMCPARRSGSPSSGSKPDAPPSAEPHRVILLDPTRWASVGADATIMVNDHDIEVGIGEELMRSMEQGIPMGRAGTPTDAADTGYLFCAPESSYITGQVIVCGGGMVI